MNFPLCLAPMVGLSHVGLRRLVREYMPVLPDKAQPLWPTEMLNSRKIPFENLSKTPETLKFQNENHLMPQILGNEEKPISESIKRLVNEWGAYAIDINMGCPVQKALKHNYGVALTGDIDYAARVVEYAKKSSTVPVTVKLRAVGETGSLDQLLKLTQKLVDAGADGLTLHPRTAAQQRRGAADWSQIKFLRDHLNVPVIGKGDVQVAQDVFDMMEQTGVERVMSGRALAARPWMVWQVAEKLNFERPEHLKNRQAPQSEYEEGAEYGQALLRLIQISEEEFCQKVGVSEALVLRKMLFYIRTTHVWLEFGHTLLSYASRAKNLEELRQGVHKFFLNEQRMFEKTELRQ